MPGVDEIAALVKGLNEQYHVATWDARHMFSHVRQKSVARVNISDYRKARSPLSQEVRSEDIPDTKRTKEWAEMDDEDYDDDYVASTDPVHPVTTDYSHPLDDDDGSWMLNHYAPEELESPSETEAVDFDGHAWIWGDDSADNHTSEEWKEENSDNDTGKWDMAEEYLSANQELTAWGPDAEPTSSSVDLDLQGLRDEATTVRNERIQQVIQAFWDVVNNTDQQPQHPTSELNSLLHKLDISSCPSGTTSPPSTPTKTSHQWMDGPSDSPPTSPCQSSASSSTSSTVSSPLSPPLLSTPSSPNTTRAKYDKQRKYLKARREIVKNLTQYYSDWLLPSRWEVRAFEGPGGQFVPDPQMVRVGRGGGGNGWF